MSRRDGYQANEIAEASKLSRHKNYLASIATWHIDINAIADTKLKEFVTWLITELLASAVAYDSLKEAINNLIKVIDESKTANGGI